MMVYGLGLLALDFRALFNEVKLALSLELFRFYWLSFDFWDPLACMPALIMSNMAIIRMIGIEQTLFLLNKACFIIWDSQACTVYTVQSCLQCNTKFVLQIIDLIFQFRNGWNIHV